MNLSSHTHPMRDFVMQMAITKWLMLFLFNSIIVICFAIFSDLSLGMHWIWVVPFLVILLPVLLCVPLFYVQFVLNARLERLKANIVGMPRALNAIKNGIVILVDNIFYYSIYGGIGWGVYKFLTYIGTMDI